MSFLFVVGFRTYIGLHFSSFTVSNSWLWGHKKRHLSASFIFSYPSSYHYNAYPSNAHKTSLSGKAPQTTQLLFLLFNTIPYLKYRKYKISSFSMKLITAFSTSFNSELTSIPYWTTYIFVYFDKIFLHF